MKTSGADRLGTPLAELWTIQQLSAFLGIPVGTLYQWRHRGDGPPAFRVGRHLRFDPVEVRRWLLDRAT
jgi:excisionase family DNA binding protein